MADIITPPQFQIDEPPHQIEGKNVIIRADLFVAYIQSVSTALLSIETFSNGLALRISKLEAEKWKNDE